MDMRTCHGPSKGHFCRDKRCDLCGRMGDDTPSKGCLSKLRHWGSDGGGEPRFRCDQCGKIHDVRDGTAYAGIRSDLKTYE